VPKKVEQVILLIHRHLFIDTYKSDKIKICINEMRMNCSEMSTYKRKKRSYKLYLQTDVKQNRLHDRTTELYNYTVVNRLMFIEYRYHY